MMDTLDDVYREFKIVAGTEKLTKQQRQLALLNYVLEHGGIPGAVVVLGKDDLIDMLNEQKREKQNA